MPISMLVPITLDEMRPERHHRGRILIVKTFCQPIRFSGIQNAIEDVLGNFELLAVYNLPSTVSVDSVLPNSAIVAVKEPYYEVTAVGGMVRVDHPSDFVLLEAHDSLVPPPWRANRKPDMTVSQLKEEGDKQFKAKNWKEAARFYSEALAKSDDKTHLQLTVHRNRAQVYLNMGHYELAEQDALASIITGDNGPDAKRLNAKAYFRAGRAQYLLREFILAFGHFDKAFRLDPTDKAVVAEIERILERSRELGSGEFDFTAMARSTTLSNRRLDHASFTTKTRIASAGNKGRGLFATEDIKHGGLVMVEKAFSATFGDELGNDHSMIINLDSERVKYGAHWESLYATIHKMRQNPNQASKILDLFDGGKFQRKRANCVDGSAVVDAFQVQAIIERNGFGCPMIRSTMDIDTDWAKLSCGIWIHAGYMNHSCLPNARRAFFGDMTIVRAICDIKSGDEILMDYEPAGSTLESREINIRRHGVNCNCVFCQAERKLQTSALREGGNLTREVIHFVANNLQHTRDIWGPPGCESILAQGKEILRRVDATYDEYGYGTLPRLTGVSINMWLLVVEITTCQAGLSSRPDLAAATQLLNKLGYRIDVDSPEASIDRTNGVICPKTVHAANLAWHAFHLAGRRDVAMQLDELAKEVYVAIVGNLDGFNPRSIFL